MLLIIRRYDLNIRGHLNIKIQSRGIIIGKLAYRSMMILQYGQSISIAIVIYPDPVIMKMLYYFMAISVGRTCYPHYTYVNNYDTKNSVKPKGNILLET